MAVGTHATTQVLNAKVTDFMSGNAGVANVAQTSIKLNPGEALKTSAMAVAAHSEARAALMQSVSAQPIGKAPVTDLGAKGPSFLKQAGQMAAVGVIGAVAGPGAAVVAAGAMAVKDAVGFALGSGHAGEKHAAVDKMPSAFKAIEAPGKDDAFGYMKSSWENEDPLSPSNLITKTVQAAPAPAVGIRKDTQIAANKVADSLKPEELRDALASVGAAEQQARNVQGKAFAELNLRGVDDVPNAMKPKEFEAPKGMKAPAPTSPMGFGFG